MAGGSDIAPGRGTGGWRHGPRLPGLLLLALIGAALIGGFTLTWRTIEAERIERAQATRTNAVLLTLRDIGRTAVNGETGQRGYYITLDRRYLAPYIAARSQYRGQVDRLRALMGTNVTPRQRELLAEIQHLNDARFAELNETVDQIAVGDIEAARKRILSDEGQDVMERLRRALFELEQIERTALDRAVNEAAASEARIIPLLLLLLLFILAALALGLWLVTRTADAEARAANAHALALARDRADLLAHELNHRVKNLFAVVLAIVKMTGRDVPEAKATIDSIAGRIHALLTAHEVTQGNSMRRSGSLGDLVSVTLEPYRSSENHCAIEGPQVEVPERKVVPLGLVLHELATNAVKYGAWAKPGGQLSVHWTVASDHLRLVWHENCTGRDVTLPEGAKGFGTVLIEGSARQLDGTISREGHECGIEVVIEFPLGE
jgi:two-component sensor histidine kinase